MDLLTNNEKSKSLATIQDIAFELLEQEMAADYSSSNKENTIILLGSKGVGKSTIIHRFLNSTDDDTLLLPPTLALEYNYCRRSLNSTNRHHHHHQQQQQQQQEQKQKLHLWELGSLQDIPELLQLPFQIHGMKNIKIIIVVDLSQPDVIVRDLQMALDGLKAACYRHLDNSKSTDVGGDKEFSIGLATLAAIPIVIVGGKYDIYIQFDRALKEYICQHLLSIAEAIGIGLLFYSKGIERLVKALRNTICHLGFGSPTNPFQQQQRDYNDALLIWFDHNTSNTVKVLEQDEIENVSKRDIFNLECIKDSYNSKLMEMYKRNTNEIVEQQSGFINPLKDSNFHESTIDELLRQKMKFIN